MKGSNRMRRRIGVTALALTGMVSALVVPSSPASAFTKPAQRYGGYGSGVETFANVGQAGQVLQAQVAVARSAADSGGLTPITDELGNVVTPGEDKAARALGAALQLKALNTPVQLVANAVATAPPTGPEVVNSLLKLPISSVAFADTLEGRAAARFNDNGVCVIGADLANGRGQAANVQLLGSAGSAAGLTNPLVSLQDPNPGERNVVNTISRQLLTGQVNRNGTSAGNKVGVLSEVTETVAPVTISANGVAAITVEVAGVYQLRAFAGGVPGSAFVEYNPATPGAAMPVIKLTFPPAGPLGGLLGGLLGALPANVQSLVSFNPATGSLLVPLGPALSLIQPLVNLLATLGIVIGEQPRAIGSGAAPTEKADGTGSAAAIDLVRIRPAGAIAALAAVAPDVRVGHMEVLAFAPPGGIDCPGLGVAKTSDKDPVQVGETFTYTITATNPYDCVLSNVKVVDDITSTGGVTFSIGTTTPQASATNQLSGGGTQVVFNNIGPIPPRGTGSVKIQVTVSGASSSGRISDTATVTAQCATGGAAGGVGINLNLAGKVTLNAPQVGGVGVSGNLPRTGRNDGIYLILGLGLLMAMAGVESVRRRARSQS